MLEQIVEDQGLGEARYIMEGKMLWLVPNWACNRAAKPCGICFASDVMRDAERNDYLHAKDDFFEKTAVISQFPWREVVITGGEPTQDSQMLRKTLQHIDPRRRVRIITNGDWVLDSARKEEILSIIYSYGLGRARVEISGHDSEAVLKRKVEALKGRVRLGVQLRKEEGEDYEAKRAFVRQNGGTFLEDHHVLGLGEIKQQESCNRSSKLLDLGKLVNYTHKENNGVYLVVAKDGTRVIANHEVPYLVHPTPADIVDLNDTPEVARRKILEFYATYFYREDRNETGYIEAAFRTGVPLELGRFFYPNYYCDRNLFLEAINEKKKWAKCLTDVYYGIVSELSGRSIGDIKSLVIKSIADRILNILNQKESGIILLPFFTPYCSFSVSAIAYAADREPESFAAVISGDLIRGHFREGNYQPNCNVDSRKALDIFFSNNVYRNNFSDPKEDFCAQLDVLGISLQEVQEQIEQALAYS